MKLIVLPSESQELHGTQNSKMAGSGITWCPEIEGASPCKWMEGSNFRETPKCPECYSAKTGPVRRANWTGRQVTPKEGLIRLGTNREVLRADYEAFLAGRGTRDTGETWERPDFPQRPHFVITRGLEGWDFYQLMFQNPRCLNVQVSVDILIEADGTVNQYPDTARLKQFAAVEKVLFRFKTLAAPQQVKDRHYGRNIEHFQALRQELNLSAMRVLETPLRINKNRTYQTETPLEQAGWDSQSFMRCNSECNACPSSANELGENRVLACAATEKVVAMLERIKNVQPKRMEHVIPKVARYPWRDLTRRAMAQLGGKAVLQDIYAKVRELEPGVVANHYHEVKIRESVQHLAQRTGPGEWALIEPDGQP